MTQEIHVGQLIKSVFEEQGRSVEWFAKKMHCNRSNVYKIFEHQSLNSDIILRASRTLSHDFFHDISKAINL